MKALKSGFMNGKSGCASADENTGYDTLGTKEVAALHDLSTGGFTQ